MAVEEERRLGGRLVLRQQPNLVMLTRSKPVTRVIHHGAANLALTWRSEKVIVKWKTNSPTTMK